MINIIKSILFLACAANAAKIVVDDRPGKGDFTTIQAAEIAASDGDTIEIRPSSDSRGYREEVTVTTPNLTITGKASKASKMRARALKTTFPENKSSKKKKNDRDLRGGKGGGGGGKGGDSFPFDALDKRGFLSLDEQPDCPDVFLDGCDDGGRCDNAVLTIEAPGVTIENLFIRHGVIDFASGSDGGKVLENCLLGATSAVVRSFSGSANSITVSNNFFQGGSSHSVNLFGNFHEISYNLATPCDDGFYIVGDDALVTNNKMFGCNDFAIKYTGNGGTITDNDIYHSDDTIEYSGNNGVITGNTIAGGYYGIEYSGDGGIITNNEITFAFWKGIYYVGDNGIIASNEVSSVGISDGIDYFGDNGVITSNSVSYVGSNGLDYTGDNPTITKNIIEFSQSEGIDLFCGPFRTTCTGGTIAHNEIIGGADDDEGIFIANANNFLIEHNSIAYSTDIGLEFYGDSSIIRFNTIARCGTDQEREMYGMQVGGSNNMIEDNKLNYNTGDGINQDRGDNNAYRRNSITGNGRAGIRIESGNGSEIVDNFIMDNHGEGISIEGGSSTEVRDNEVTDNRIDICNDVGNTIASDNTFDTGGFATDCLSALS